MPAEDTLEEGAGMTANRKTEIILLALLAIEAAILIARFT